MGKIHHTGIVYLVGAGPGDADLITRRGFDLLQQCDAVLYDHLIAPELIAGLPPRIERTYVGKQAGAHAFAQEEINARLVELARQGKRVVRLKGGDPFVFGRGGEEAEYLAAHQIPFEVVPGVTAGVGGLAYAGIPATHRGLATHVTFVTGHRSDSSAESPVPWERLAALENGSLVGYMGVGQLPRIVERLLTAGMLPETPAAVIERGTRGTQRTISATLRELPQTAEAAGIRPPALFVIGKVVTLRETLGWFEQLPLFGRRVLVTRPVEQSLELYGQLRRLGAEVLPWPTVAIGPEFDARGWARIQSRCRPGDWLYLASENGAKYFLQQWRRQGRDLRGLSVFSIAAVGRGAMRALEPVGIQPDLVVETPTTEGLALEMAERLNLADRRVVRVRGNLGDERPDEILSAAKAEVISLVVYRSYTPRWDQERIDGCLAQPPEIILFSSGASVTGLVQILGEDPARELCRNAITATIGPSTSRAAVKNGIEPTVESSEPSLEGLVQAVVSYVLRAGSAPARHARGGPGRP